MTQRLMFQHKYKSFGCENDVHLSFSDRLLMCKNTILIYYQHMGQFFLVGATKVCACDKAKFPRRKFLKLRETTFLNKAISIH